MKLGCLIAPTAADIRDVMVEGPSGLIAVAPPWSRPRFESSKRRVEWPNGARAVCLSGEEPERARGLNIDTLWADELACWQRAESTWDLAMLAETGDLKIHPRCTRLKDAFRNYSRQRRGGQWVDFPADGHPEEDLMDALRGGIRDAMPAGLAPGPRVHQVRAAGILIMSTSEYNLVRAPAIVPTISALRPKSFPALKIGDGPPRKSAKKRQKAPLAEHPISLSRAGG